LIPPFLLVALLEALCAGVKHSAGHPLDTGSIAATDWSTSVHVRIRLGSKSTISLHLVDQGKHGSGSGIGDTVGGLGIIESAPLDLSSLIASRKVHVEGSPVLDGIALGGIKDVTTE